MSESFTRQRVPSTPTGAFDSETPTKLGLFEKLLLAAVALMPFQSALTFAVGFPLKASELLLGAAVTVYLFTPRRMKIRPDAASALVWVLMVVLAISTLINILIPISASVQGYDRGFTVDLLLYFAYGNIALIFWRLLRHLDPSWFARAIVLSVWLCGAATLFQFSMISVGATSLLDALNFTTTGTGIDLSDASSGATQLRSGPFLEGQHLGFFAGAGLFVCLYRKAYLASLIAIACIIYSQSTTAIIGVVFGLVVAVAVRPGIKLWVVAVAILGGGAALMTFSTQARVFIDFQLAKLGLIEGASRYATLSLDLRSIKTEIGLRIAAERPIFGVGPGRYGINFYDFADDYVSLPQYYYRAGYRAIAENAYAQIAAELGLLALFCFAALLVALIIRNFRSSTTILALTTSLVVTVSTQSSWTFLPIWTFLGFCALQYSAQTVARDSSRRWSSSNGAGLSSRTRLRRPRDEDQDL